MAQTFDYDLLVIGGGPAGEKAAAQAAHRGFKVALVERFRELGGACINWGTLASKTLRESAVFLAGFRGRQLDDALEIDLKPNLSLANFMARRNLVQRHEHQRAAARLESHRAAVERIGGDAAIAGPHAVRVSAPHGPRMVTARRIIIATGSLPSRPAHIPFNEDNIFDPTSILDMRRVPKSMVVVGGGVIGAEYACVFATLGVKVTLVHSKPHIMESLLDVEIGAEFLRRARERGIELCLSDVLESVSFEGELVRCRLKSGAVLLTDALLYATGRHGATSGLGLESMGIPIGPRGHIERVDPHTYQTIVPSIYAAGDVIGRPGLASTSMEQGRRAASHALGLPDANKPPAVMPSSMFTIPEISQVGLTEQECQRNGIPYVVGRGRYGQHARGQIIGDTQGLIKIVIDFATRKVLGVHVIGELASELIHIGVTVMHFGGTVDDLSDLVFNYPTLGDVYKDAAFDAADKLSADAPAAVG